MLKGLHSLLAVKGTRLRHQNGDGVIGIDLRFLAKRGITHRDAMRCLYAFPAFCSCDHAGEGRVLGRLRWLPGHALGDDET